MTPIIILNELKHRKVDLEQFLKEKVALEEKIGEEDVIEEDNQRLLECIGMITRHKREIKRFEDWSVREKTTLPLTFEKVSDVNSVKLKAGVMSSVPLSFFSVGGKGMVSVFIVSLPSVGVGVEAVRLAEPVVEDVKVNKQMLADANKLMADARFKGMKAVASLAGHRGRICSVAFSPDGQHIVSGSEDRLVKVTGSLSGGKEVASLAGHTHYVFSVAFSPDGQHIVSGSWDKLVKVWS